MKTNLKSVIGTGALVGAAILLAAASGPPVGEISNRTAVATPMKMGEKIPLSMTSPAVEWKQNTFHLVRLGSIAFTLDEATGHLKAEVESATTSFDDVVYDVSAAVFDEAGQLLGTARAQVKVQRVWLGKVFAMSHEPLSLDFGLSLDYSRAKTFMIGINKRKVLTPDDWQAVK